MSDTAIIVEGLGKRYQLGELASSGDVVRGARRLARRLVGRPDETPAADNSFWAVRDLSFEVKRGEVLGVIGRNGAGKSTLLKLLSRITAPTEGRIRVRGRVASLLEVGTGMHPELTGRENVYLNGSLLGMTKREIDAKFDEIVDFAGVEKFIDTPFKRYSSGMRVRLGFAVAAHLEPEILIIDEVLAVGDAEFQAKCLGKMQDVADHGRTVLFVSHNMAAVTALCFKGLWLERGRVRDLSDDIRTMVAHYLRGGVSDDANTALWINSDGTMTDSSFHPWRFYLSDASGAIATMPVRNDDDVYVCIDGRITIPDIALNVGYALYDSTGTLLYWTTTTDAAAHEWPKLSPGNVTLRSQLPRRLLNEGRYRLEMMVSLYHRQWISRPGANAPGIDVVIQGGLSDSPYWMERRPGVIAPVCKWSLQHTFERAGI